MKRYFSQLILFIFLGSMMLSFQNCGEPQHAAGSGSSSSSSLTGEDPNAWEANPALQTQALDILTTSCSGCHGVNGQGDVSNINNVSHLIETGLIVPGESDQGRIIGAIADQSMPPAAPLSSAQLSIIQDWVASFQKVSSPPPDNGGNSGGGAPVVEATFESIYKNIIVPKCISCHGNQRSLGDTNVEGHVNLTTTIQSNSDFMDMLRAGEMPPANSGYSALSSEELALLQQWIDMGMLNN